MRHLAILTSLFCAFTAASIAQLDTAGAPQTIYTAAADVTAPQLLASASSRSYSEASCRSDEDGAATFSLIVDSAGEPRNIYFLSPIGDDLDLIALKEVIADRFHPGVRGGQPVAVAASVDVKLHACLAERKDDHGKTQNVLQLTAAPVQELKPAVDPPQQAILVSGSGVSNNPADPDAGIEKVGGDITAPQYVPTPAAGEQGLKLLGGGRYKVSVVVDRYGLPERLRILDAEMPGKEPQIAAVFRLYRWKPAMKGGVPVPVRIETGTNAAASAGGRRR